MLLIHIFLVAALLISDAVLPRAEYVVVKGNKITVQAHTTLGSINCSYTSSNLRDTLTLNKYHPEKDRLKLAIPVDQFNCGNKILNKDFANTLQVQKHPYIQIELISLKKQSRDYRGQLKLEVAGKTILLDDVQFVSSCANSANLLKSNICLNFSEIGIATPKKMGGLFKVEDELEITVELQLSSRAKQAPIPNSIVRS